jgi:hypothetical protein
MLVAGLGVAVAMPFVGIGFAVAVCGYMAFCLISAIYGIIVATR